MNFLVTLPRVELGTPPWKGDDLTDCPKRHIKRRADCSNYRHNFLQSKIFSNSALARRPILRIGTPVGYLPQEEESNPSQSIIFYSTADFSSLCFIRRYLPNLEMRLHRSLFLATSRGIEPLSVKWQSTILTIKLRSHIIILKWWAYRDSNPNLKLRRLLHYPVML